MTDKPIKQSNLVGFEEDKLESYIKSVDKDLKNLFTYTGITSNFYDRGDATDWDYEVGDLTTDLTWYDLDLSSIIDKKSKAVLLRVQCTDDAVGSFLIFRKKGNTGLYNLSIISTQVANVEIAGDFIVPCDKNQTIQYRGSNLAFTSIYIVVKGWWQ